MSDFRFRRTWGPTPRYERVLAYRPPSNEFIIIGGPCSVESEKQINEVAQIVADSKATHLRGGVFRAGTYPGQNFGLIDQELIKAYWHAGKSRGLKTIIEVLDYNEHMVDKVAPYADCFQVGCRQMQNYTLLRSLPAWKKPILLKRNPGATIDEFLGAAEHLLAAGATEVILIERGSATNATHVRWDLSISMIPAIKEITQMPVVVDASHGTGRRDLVRPMTLAGVAAGAGGILVEVHTDPERSLSDADQAVSPFLFSEIVAQTRMVRNALYRL